jgi:hypothetical protein
MLTKVVPTGSDAGGLLSYLMDEEKESELYGGNVAGQNYAEIMAEWRAVSQQNRRTDKDTKHITLSPHPRDRVSPQDWFDICEYMVQELGYTNNLWLVIKHKPTPSQLQQHPEAQPHVHLMINTIEVEGFTRVNDWQDQTKAEQVTRQIEESWNLYRVTPSSEAQYSAPTTGQKRRMMREQLEFEAGLRATPPEEPTKLKLERLVVAATQGQPRVSTFVERLQKQGVDVYPAIIGHALKGFSFEYEGFRCRGSKLKNCSWKKLTEVRGLRYEPNVDLPILEAVATGEDLGEARKRRFELQQQRVNQVAPLCAAILELMKTHSWQGKHYKTEWESPYLTLWQTDNSNPMMKAQWTGERWVERGSNLSPETVDYFEDVVRPSVQLAWEKQEAERRKQQKPKQLEL